MSPYDVTKARITFRLGWSPGRRSLPEEVARGQSAPSGFALRDSVFVPLGWWKNHGVTTGVRDEAKRRYHGGGWRPTDPRGDLKKESPLGPVHARGV